MNRSAVVSIHRYSCSVNSRRIINKVLVSKRTYASSEKTASEGEPISKNPMNIQMLFPSLHKQIFKNKPSSGDNSSNVKIQNSIESLKTHGLWGKESSPIPLVDLNLPYLHGENIDDHFRHIANQQSAKYIELGDSLARSQLADMPKLWTLQSGWTKYNADGSSTAVDFPEEDAMVFDVEVLVTESSLPIMAAAVSPLAWYSWCSSRLVEDRLTVSQNLGLNDLIPIETKAGQMKPLKNWKEKLIVGHNVSYDRARIKEQYFVKGTKTRFVDTMSLHIATSGLTGLQRALLMAELTGSKRKDVEEAKAKARGPPVKNWMNVGSLNNLADVHKLHCGGKELKKDDVEIFIKGQLSDVQKNFQNLMTYCANDVKATFEVFEVLWPLFFERFPHPVTFAGMLEMSVAYLPVNNNWQKYLNSSQTTFNDLERELKLMLMRLANDACELLHDDAYKNDVWLWDLNWTVRELKSKKVPAVKVSKTKSRKMKNGQQLLNADEPAHSKESEEQSDDLKSPVVTETLQTVDYLYIKRPNLPGYPAWFCELCPKLVDDEEWTPGPTLISPQMQVVPKLLRLTWEGYPLHYSKKNGWGYLVPGKPISMTTDEDSINFPYKNLHYENGKVIIDSEKLNNLKTSEEVSAANLDALWEKILDGSADVSENSELWNLFVSEKSSKPRKKTSARAGSESGSPNHHGNGPYLDEDIPGCWFYRLPHKDGPNNKVGNPLAKDFMNKIEDGTLKSGAGENADWALKLSKMISYWKNAHKRITSQMVVWLKKGELPKSVVDSSDFEDDTSCGAILPTIVTAGTVTRRAVEATWMTASNAYPDRVGSELKSMVQALPGYRFVGADVDSQELWIAAILGDAHDACLHGCTPFGWMTLQGKKSQETDMHSLTANTVGITRDQAKVLNYGRIYGAGEAFASRLLMQFNHRLTLEEAKSRAQKMYATTKGVKGYILNNSGKELYEYLFNSQKGNRNEVGNENNPIILSRKDVNHLLRECQSGLTLSDITKGSVWMNGTESAMFNKLEAIALSLEPKTPVLECRISKALEPSSVMDNFLTSRVNWVVQSSAVDYLHLMLVSMKWLFHQFNIDGRFSISIHDEVRYLVKTEDAYRAALALQITNLLTRSIFAYKLEMRDLPQSVAFFSSVDIDTVLRKEVNMDCKTPSNHLGLQSGYGIPPGESLDIYTILNLTKGRLDKSNPKKGLSET